MKRILVVATRQIGDVLLTTPLIRAARARWPEAAIDVLGFEGTLGILEGNPDVRERIATPARLGWSGTWRLARRLWRRYDLALITQPGDRAHLIGWIAGRTRYGLLPEAGGSNGWKRALLAHAVAIDGDRGETHVVAEKLRLLAADGEPARDPEGLHERSYHALAAHPQVVPPAGQPLPADIAALLGPRPVVVHAPSMWDYKQWPLQAYAEVVRQLLAEGRQVVLTGSASERDQACIAPLRPLGTAPHLLDLSGRLSFAQLRTLLDGAALYIGPDTSVSHLAAACGTPTVAVFGPTNPQRWAPWPAHAEGGSRGGPAGAAFRRQVPIQTVGNVTLLQGPQSCVPCGRAGCEDHHHSRSDCLQAIKPEAVLAASRQLLR